MPGGGGGGGSSDADDDKDGICAAVGSQIAQKCSKECIQDLSRDTPLPDDFWADEMPTPDPPSIPPFPQYLPAYPFSETPNVLGLLGCAYGLNTMTCEQRAPARCSKAEHRDCSALARNWIGQECG